MKRHCFLCTVKGFLATAITPRLIVSPGVCHRSSCNASTSVIAHYEDANILLPSIVGFRWLPSPGTQGNPLAERPRSSPTQTLIKEAVNVFDALLTSCTLLTIITTCIPLLQTIALPVPPATRRTLSNGGSGQDVARGSGRTCGKSLDAAVETLLSLGGGIA